MNVVIIGSGNVATILGKRILQAGHRIVEVTGRNEKNIISLAAALNATPNPDIADIDKHSDIYIISVSDSSIHTVAKQLSLNNKLVVHTAASVPQSVLKNASSNYGVIYPLQTLKKEVDIILPIPVLINGSNGETMERLLEFSATWASSVALATDEERLKLLVAAVISNNFINHLFTLVYNYCNKEGLNFELLQQLIQETVNIVRKNDPSKFQTGPAVRRDMVTIEKHQQLLEQHPQLKEVYTSLTNSIISYHHQAQ